MKLPFSPMDKMLWFPVISHRSCRSTFHEALSKAMEAALAFHSTIQRCQPIEHTPAIMHKEVLLAFGKPIRCS
jgi:hypothetical protein